MSTRRNVSVVLASVLLTFWFPLPSSADPGPYHWEGTAPRILTIENDLGPEWQTALTTAVARWNLAPEIELVIGLPGTACWDVDAQIEICEDDPGRGARWIGLSSVFKDTTGHISYAIVEVNEDKSWGPAKRLYVLCHELGHALGLRHRASLTFLPSCMVPQFRYALKPIGPDVQDYRDIASMYGHGDESAPALESPAALRPLGA